MGDLVDKRQEELKKKKICRFCLSQMLDDLTNIYSRENRMKSAPLPLQVMACVSIEVFSNDAMPSYVCSECRMMFDYCYRFKQMCKKADTCLRHYPLTGVWSNALQKPKVPTALLPQPQSQPEQKNLNSFQVPRKINSQTTLKIDLDDEESQTIMTMLQEPEHLQETELQEPEPEVEVRIMPKTHQKPPKRIVLDEKKPTKKLLNKSAVRILNKEAQQTLEEDFEPRMTKPILKRDVDGNMAVVSEILDVNDIPTEGRIDDAAVIETNVFPCPHCERSFPLRQLLDIHLVNHNRERSFLCPNCNKSFFSKYDLQKHILVHTGEKPFKCVVCEKGFTRSTLLHRHEKSHTDIPKFICVFCEKPFISQEEMERHTARHRKNRPFSCKICGKSFAFKQGLERHEIIHSRFQPFQCQYCDNSFSTPSKLARHLTAHAGVRPYPCKLCPKAYLLSHHLTRHMRSHKNGIGSYKCNDCDKTFSKRDDLIYHSAVHATQTLVCPLCKDTFENIETVTEHVKQHAEGEAFACEFCDLIYMTAERLQQHTDSDHVDEMVAYKQDANSNKTPNVRNEANNEDLDNSANQDIDDVIEEFLFDEFSDNGKEEPDTKESKLFVKEETNWQTQSVENAISKTEESRKFDTAEEEEGDITGDDEFMNLIEEGEAAYEPPAKVVKISPMVKKIVKLAPPPESTRRKLPTKQATPTTLLNFDSSSPKENKNPILKATPVTRVKSEKVSTIASPAVSKTRQPTIQAALQGLPKSLSVKKVVSEVKSALHVESVKIVPAPSTAVSKQPSAAAASPSVQKSAPKQVVLPVSASKTKPSVQPKQLPLRTRSETSPNKKPPAKASVSSRNTEEGKKSSTKVDTVASKRSAIPEDVDSETKVVEMKIGDKKVKVHKITMSKAQATAMAREGRIQIKEGTMILNKAQLPSKVTKKSN